MPASSAVHTDRVRTELTCNCLLPRLPCGAEDFNSAVIAAHYELQSTATPEGSSDPRDVAAEPLPSASSSSPARHCGALTLHARGGDAATLAAGLPGVFDIAWAHRSLFPGLLPASDADVSHVLLAAFTDGAVRLLHPQTGAVLRAVLGVHREMITSCTAFLKLSSTGGSDSAVRLLSTAHTGAVLVHGADAGSADTRALEGHAYDAWCGAVMPTDANTDDTTRQVLLSGGDDGLLKLYDLRSDYAACGRVRFDAGVVHIAPVVRTARVSDGGSADGLATVVGPTPYVLVGSYDESISLIDVRFLKRPVAQRARLGGGVWRCSRCLFPFGPSAAERTEAPPQTNYALVQRNMRVAHGTGGPSPLSATIVNEANTLVLPLMQRGPSLLSYDVTAAEDCVFGPPLPLYEATDTDDAEAAALSREPLTENCLVYDSAVLEVSTAAATGRFTAVLATCSFYEKAIDYWTVEGTVP